MESTVPFPSLEVLAFFKEHPGMHAWPSVLNYFIGAQIPQTYDEKKKFDHDRRVLYKRLNGLWRQGYLVHPKAGIWGYMELTRRQRFVLDALRDAPNGMTSTELDVASGTHSHIFDTCVLLEEKGLIRRVKYVGVPPGAKYDQTMTFFRWFVC